MWKLSWGLALVGVHGNLSSYLVGFRDALSSLAPEGTMPQDRPLEPILIRQFEQSTWEISPPPVELSKMLEIQEGEGMEDVLEKQVPPESSSVDIHDLQKLELESSDEVYQYKKISDLEPSFLDEVSSHAYKLIETSEKCARTQSHFVHFLSVSPKSGYVVVVYRPILLGADPTPDQLRLLYHSLADAQYPQLVEGLLELGPDLKSKNVLLVGAVDAGLIANYHAAMLIRQHPTLGPIGNFINARNQVQVITFDSPAPYTPDAILYYRIPSHNFIDFTTDAPDGTFARWGHHEKCTRPAKMGKKVGRTDKSFLLQCFGQQKLDSLNVDNLLTKMTILPHVNYLHFQLTARLVAADRGISAGQARFRELRKQLPLVDLHSCNEALQDQLQTIIRNKWENSEKFAEKYGLSSNWSLGKEVICTPVREISEKREIEKTAPSLVVSCAFDQYEFARYRLVITERLSQDSASKTDSWGSVVDSGQFDVNPVADLDDEEAGMEIQQPSPKKLTVQSKRAVPEKIKRSFAIKQCLRDLFELQPGMQIFSPFHTDKSTRLLTYSKWPYAQQSCQISLAEPASLKELYTHQRSAYVSLMTAPHILNPESCQRGTDPVAIVESDNRSAEYWLSFSTGSLNINGIISDGQFQDSMTTVTVQQTLINFIQSHMSKAPALRQYDCSNAQTLWHSHHFCPKICRVLGRSNLCERVHISEKGMRVSLRKGGRAGLNFDQSYIDYEVMHKMKKRFDDRATFVIRFIDQEGWNYFMAVFIEGEMYQALRAAIEDNK